MNPYDIIYYFYPQDTPLRRLLILHSEKVRDKALSILEEARRSHPSPMFDSIDENLVIAGALLHDIGIGRTHAPGILCEGTMPYICHGTIGAEMLREVSASKQGLAELQDGVSTQKVGLADLQDEVIESLARICERHTGSGLSRQDILDQQLPISPVRDLLPETMEEKLICLADKFFSKSGDPAKEKDFARVKASMMKFGTDSIERFNSLCETFYIK